MKNPMVSLLDQADDIYTIEDFYSLLTDPVFMAKVIFDIDLPPHQRVQLRAMWFNPFYIDTSGYRTGKSATATLCQTLQCLLISGWAEGIISHAFRGATFLFRDHIDNWYNACPRYRALVSKPPTHGNSEWRIEYTNGSATTAYPSDLLNDALRLESLSLHGMTADEITAFPNPSVLWNVILTRVTKPVPPIAQQLGITNTKRMLGAAKYAFQQIYKAKNGEGGIVQMVIENMAKWQDNMSEPPRYMFLSLNIADYLPPDELCWACGGSTENIGIGHNGKTYVKCKKCGYERVAWRKFFHSSLQTEQDAKRLMSSKLHAMRWGGWWQETSEDVYNGTKVMEMYQPDVKIETERPKDDKSRYVVGVDIGTGSTERHSVSAISVIKKSPNDPRYKYVYAKRIPKIHETSATLTELSGHLYWLYMRFQPDRFVIDSGGGGVWLIDADHLAGRTQIIPASHGIIHKKNTTPLLLVDDKIHDGAHIVELFTPTTDMLAKSIGTMKASDQLMNWAHENVSGLIDHNEVVAPDYTVDGQQENDETAQCIAIALDGLLEIGKVQNPNGEYELTGNGFFQYAPKPDLAYSFVYALAGAYLRENKKETDEEDEGDMVFGSSAIHETEKGKIFGVGEAKEDTGIAVAGVNL